VLDPDDAEVAASTGAEALVVSNHGGRQLDGAPSTIAALPAIVERVGGRTEGLIDGGFYSGQDVFRALAMGASGVMLGRAINYGLGAGGEAGARRALDIIRHELVTTMGLCGVSAIDQISSDNLSPPDRAAAEARSRNLTASPKTPGRRPSCQVGPNSWLQPPIPRFFPTASSVLQTDALCIGRFRRRPPKSNVAFRLMENACKQWHDTPAQSATFLGLPPQERVRDDGRQHEDQNEIWS